jgi:thiosulfate dehydrogenase
VLPPLWGQNSYNDGAGMNNPKKMAAFLIHNMPLNHPDALTPQDAFNVAAFVHTMPRPKFNQAYKNY